MNIQVTEKAKRELTKVVAENPRQGLRVVFEGFG